MIVELALWSDAHIREFHEIRSDEGLALMKEDREGFIQCLKDTYQKQNRMG